MNCKVLNCPDVLSFDEIGATEVALLVASASLRVENANWETAQQSHELGQLNTHTLMFKLQTWYMFLTPQT
jgi:hypothetical protein